MWNASDLWGSLRAASQRMLRAGVAACALVSIFAIAGPVLAQEPAPPPPAPPAASAPVAAPAESRQGLRQTLEKSYEVLPLHNGVVLRPRKERLGVRTIELSGDTIAVNGERVTEGVLRAWLAADADPVLRLYRLPPRERQALFGMQSGEVPAAAAPAEQAAPGLTTGETEIPAEGEPPAEAPDTAPPVPPAPPSAAPPDTDTSDTPASTSGSKVNLFGGITVEKDELAEEAVAILGSVHVEGEVSGDVTAVGGSTIINGRVGGSVTAVGGGVRLGPKAVVDGDVTSVGGSIVRAEGSRVQGQTSEVAMVPSGGDWGDVDISFSPFLNGTMDLFWQLASTGILALLVGLVLLVARGPMDKVELQVVREPWLAGGVGFLAQVILVLLAVPVTILLIITIVGCALIALYPFLFIALWLAALVGYAAVAHRLGSFLEVRFGRRFGSPYAVALVGVLAIEMWSLLGRVIGLAGGPLRFISFGILLFGFLVRYVAWTVGFGAVLMARFGSSRGGALPATVPPPPPAPVPYDPVLDEPRLNPEPVPPPPEA
jgi:hypothetical protein